MAEIQRIEKEIRCKGLWREKSFDGVVREKTCGRLLNKVTVIVSIPDELRKKGNSLSEAVPDIEVKFWHETKCNRCKFVNSNLEVA